MPCQGTGSCMCWEHILSTCRDGVHLGWVEDFFQSLVFAGFTNSHVTNYSCLFSLVLIKYEWHFWCIATLYIFVKGWSNKLAPCLVWCLRSGYTSRFAPQTLRSILQQCWHLCRGLECTSWDRCKVGTAFQCEFFLWCMIIPLGNAYLLGQKCKHQSKVVSTHVWNTPRNLYQQAEGQFARAPDRTVCLLGGVDVGKQLHCSVPCNVAAVCAKVFLWVLQLRKEVGLLRHQLRGTSQRFETVVSGQLVTDYGSCILPRVIECYRFWIPFASFALDLFDFVIPTSEKAGSAL